MEIHRFKHRQIPPAVRHGCFKDAVTTAWCKRKGHEKKKAWEDVEKKISTPPSLVPTAQKHNKWNVLWMLHGAHGSLCWSMTKSDDAFCESQDVVIPIWNWKVQLSPLQGEIHFCTPDWSGEFFHHQAGNTWGTWHCGVEVWTRASGCTLSTRLYFDELCTLGHPWCSPALGRTVTTRHPPHLSLNNELFFAQHQEEHLGRGCLCFYPFSPSLAYSLAYSKLGCKALSQIVDKKIHPLF